MVKSATSLGVKEALGISLLERLMQYLQLYMQQLVIKIFNNEIHLPSADQL